MSTPTENLNTSTDTAAQPDVMLQVTDEPASTTVQPDTTAITAAQPATPPIEGAQPDPANPDVAQPEAGDATIDLATQASAEAVEPQPHDVFAPLFETYADNGAAVTAAIDSLEKLYAYDQPAYFALANGLYHSNKAWYEERALTEAGIPKEKIVQFKEWANSGAELTVPDAVKFPEPDQDGLAEFKGIQYDTNTSIGKELYENAKFRHEYEAEKAATATQKAADDKRQADTAAAAEQTKLHEAREARVNTFSADRNNYVVSQVQEATKDYGSPLLQGVAYSLVSQLMAGEIPEMLKNVPELKSALDQVGLLNTLSDRAGAHIINGDGRTADFAKAADAITKKLIEAALSPLNRMIARTSQAERVALAGVPKIPSAAVVTAGTQVETDGKPKTEAEIEKTLQAGIAKKFGS